MKQFPVVAASVLLCLPLLAGCSGLREAAGLTKKSPDEFAVTTKAPLVVPPNFNLRPPTPGAPPTQQADPSTRAEMALFNQQDPETVARGMTGNYTMAEKLLLAHAGAQDADPAVRTKLLSDIRSMQAADASFTDRVLGAASASSRRSRVDCARRWRRDPTRRDPPSARANRSSVRRPGKPRRIAS